MLTPETKALVAECAPLLHERKRGAVAQRLIAFYKIKGLRVGGKDSDKKTLPIIMAFLHNLMEQGTEGMTAAAQLLWTPTLFTPKPQSVREVWELFDSADRGLIMGAARLGKCLHPDTACRRFDGTEILAKNVKTGDLLAGDDGTPRRVTSTVSGKEMLYEVSVKNVPGFLCTGDHLLTLVCTHERPAKKKLGGSRGQYERTLSKDRVGEVRDITVREWLSWSKTKQRRWAAFVKGFDRPEAKLRVDPYIYGSWLGDGTSCRCELTSPDGPMMAAWNDYWSRLGFRVVEADKPITKSVRGQVEGEAIWPNAWVRRSVFGGEKRIRFKYQMASRAQRLALLAGIIDADGTSTGAGYNIVSKWKSLADDIEKLARGLGFFVHRHAREHGIKSTGFRATYYHVTIQGDCSSIPTREKSVSRIGKHKILNAARFSIKESSEQEYAGFSLDGNHRFLLASGLVTHNSFSMGVRLFLEWVRDPEYTTVRVLGPSEDHLEQNLFSHLVGLHKNASLPMPGEVGELFIGLNRREQMSSIKGIIIPKGNSKKAGRLQGGHRRPRTKPHPRFGNLSRMFIFLDEIENIPNGVWLDIDNVLSEIEKGSQGFKVFGAYNPTNPYDEVGKRAEPPFGWGDLDADSHFRWKSKRGWDVLRLDGERCENVVLGEVVFPGLQTRDGLEAIAQGAGGRTASGYMTMGRGMYPPVGMAATVVPAGMFPKWRGEFVWYDPPQPVVGVDLAFEGGDVAIYTLGKWGRASGAKYPPNLEHPNGRTVMFKDPRGQVTPRWGLEVTQQFTLPKGDTVAMKNVILEMNRKCGVRPEFFAVDRTGHGSGVADLLKYEWSSAIWDVNYTEGSGEEKLMAEDTKTCKEMYERMYSVLWFALRQWGEFGYLLLNPALDLSKLMQQITNRQTQTISGRSKVESKKDYKSRGFNSPDEADSLTLIVHAARKGSGLVLSRRGENVELGSNPFDDWPGEYYPGGARIDSTNRSDFLDERAQPDFSGMAIL